MPVRSDQSFAIDYQTPPMWAASHPNLIRVTHNRSSDLYINVITYDNANDASAEHILMIPSGVEVTIPAYGGYIAQLMLLDDGVTNNGPSDNFQITKIEFGTAP